MVPEDFSPDLGDGLVIAQYDIVRIELNHFLETDHNKIDILPRKIKQPFHILRSQGLRINHITVPRDRIDPKLLIRTIFIFLQHLTRNIIFEILQRIRFLFLLAQQKIQTFLLRRVIHASIVVPIDRFYPGRQIRKERIILFLCKMACHAFCPAVDPGDLVAELLPG